MQKVVKTGQRKEMKMAVQEGEIYVQKLGQKRAVQSEEKGLQTKVKRGQ